MTSQRSSFYQNDREVRLLVVHCSATRCDRDFPVATLRAAHLARGFSDIGYHFYITRDGALHPCRPIAQIGAHARGWNSHSIGICYEGGLDPQGHPADTRTWAQRRTLLALLCQLHQDYPQAQILGHYQLSPTIHKACPCFDARKEYEGIAQLGQYNFSFRDFPENNVKYLADSVEKCSFAKREK